MSKKIFFSFFLFPSILYSSILILPFENKSHRNYFWLSESISYSLYSTFIEEGLEVISPEKRNLIYEELQIPITTPITRATSIKIGNLARAEKVITGDFVVVEDKVIVSSQIIDLKKERLEETISVEGNINELILLQNFLTWRLLQKIKNVDESKMENFLKNWSNVSLPAWENFIKGLLTKDNEKKELFLLKSLNLSPDFSLARWELSYYYFKKGDFQKCLKYIKPLIDLKPFSLFIASLCHFYMKDYDKAIEGFKTCLVRGIEKASSSNNIGVCLAKKGEKEKALEYFKIALSQGDDPDIYFNIALISNNKEDFLENIKKAIQLSKPNFRYFHSLYQKLVLLQENEISEIVKGIAKEYFSYDIDESVSDFKDFLVVMEEKKEIHSWKDEVNYYKKESLSFLESENLGSAELSIKKAIHLSPLDWEAHLILSRILFNKKDFKSALKELKFSLWIDDRAENNFEMGKLLVEMGNKEKGLEHLKKAVYFDPSLKEAKELIKKVEK